MRIAIRDWRGERPGISARRLPDGFAQTAENCRLFPLKLQPWNGTTFVETPTKEGTKETIHLMAGSIWLHWTDQVSVARGPLSNTDERTYFTGTDQPRVTDSQDAVSGGTDYPEVSYLLGVPAPTTKPTVAVAGTPPETESENETRFYVYTFVTDWDEEGPPSPVSDEVELGPDEYIELSVLETAPVGAYQITKKRIYRALSGTTDTEYHFVAEIDIATTSYDDQVDGDTVAAASIIVSTEWDPPPTAMENITAMANGILVGSVGNRVLFCEPYQCHAWPGSYELVLDYDVVGIAAAGNTAIVTTEGDPYLVVGTHPANMTSQKLEGKDACVSSRSVVDGGEWVMYAGPRGICAIAAGSWSLLTDGVITQDEWSAFTPSSMHAYWYHGLYIAFYDTGATQGGVIFNPTTQELTLTDVYATAGYNDVAANILYLMIDDDIESWHTDSDNPLTVEYKTKVYETIPVNFSVGRVEADAYPVTMKLYADGVLKHTEAVADDAPFRMPGGYLARAWEILLSGTKSVTAVYIAETVEELEP